MFQELPGKNNGFLQIVLNDKIMKFIQNFQGLIVKDEKFFWTFSKSLWGKVQLSGASCPTTLTFIYLFFFCKIFKDFLEKKIVIIYNCMPKNSATSFKLFRDFQRSLKKIVDFYKNFQKVKITKKSWIECRLFGKSTSCPKNSRF